MTSLLPHTRRAFTLLELLLVLAVVAILAGFAVPRLSGSLRSQRLDAQVRTVIALARKARALAAAEGRSYELVLEAEGRTLRLARQRDPLAAPSDDEFPEREAIAEDEAWSRPLDFEDEVTLTEAIDLSLDLEGEALDLAEPVSIRFAPDGSAEARELAFKTGERELRVRIQPHLGRAVLLEADVEGVSR